MTMWPQQLKWLAAEYKKIHYKRRGTWVLDICGPFCLFPPPPLDQKGYYSSRSRITLLQGRISDYLRLPTVGSHNQNALTIQVIVTDYLKQSLLQEVYESVTRKGT